MDAHLYRRSQLKTLWERQGKSVTRCAFIIFYVILVVASYTVLQGTTYIAFGVSLYMIASGVLFGIFVFACGGSGTRLCECCRFGCALVLALALTFFILVSGGVAADAAAQSHSALLPRPSLLLDTVIVASIGLFVVIVILLPVLAPVKIQGRETDRMTIQMTAVYAQFASRSDRGSNGSAVNPTLLIGNGTGPPGTETLLLYSRVRGQPPTYEESQLRNSQREQAGPSIRRSSASSNNSSRAKMSKTVFVFSGGSLDRTRMSPTPTCPPPPYDEQDLQSSALIIQKQIQNGTATTTVWSSESGLGTHGISIEGLFPPSYEEATEWERPSSTRRRERPELFGGNQPGTSRANYYCADRYYVHHQQPQQLSIAGNQGSPSTSSDWRSRARSILDSCSDTDDSRNGTLQRPQPKAISSSADYLAQSQQQQQQQQQIQQQHQHQQQQPQQVQLPPPPPQQQQVQVQPPAQTQQFPFVANSYPMYGTLPLQHHRQQPTLVGGSLMVGTSQIFPNPNRVALPVEANACATLRPSADWGRYNRIRSFLDNSETSAEEAAAEIPSVHNYVNYRTYHGGRRYQNHWRRQYAMDEYHGMVYGTTGRMMCHQSRTAYYYPHTGSLQRPINHAINTPGLPNCPQRSSSTTSSCGCPHEEQRLSINSMYYPVCTNSLASVNNLPPT